LVYSPGGNGKTILRAGLGVFHDRVPLLASSFTQNPERIVQVFDAHGTALGPPATLRNAYLDVERPGRPRYSVRCLKTTAYNMTWSAEGDRDLRPSLVARVSYLSSRTFKQYVIDPQLGSATNSLLLLANSVENRYYEFESTLRFRPRERSELNV